jgi:E3 ubiquitin-protein ligase RNF14
MFRLSTTSSWLPNAVLAQLKEQGDKLWEDLGRGQVVFDYIDHLQQAAERGFDLGSPLKVPQDLKILLLDFDSKTKREKFEQETFDCGICLVGSYTGCASCAESLYLPDVEPKKGSACHRMLLCAHVFCVECLQDFYNTCITEGDITNVKCLALIVGKISNQRSSPTIQKLHSHGRRGGKKTEASIRVNFTNSTRARDCAEICQAQAKEETRV